MSEIKKLIEQTEKEYNNTFISHYGSPSVFNERLRRRY